MGRVFQHGDEYEVIDPDEFEDGDQINSTAVIDNGAPEV